MKLRSIDLNLLAIFDALMAERHVTRAANKVALSQPALSNALARLRQTFDDELFVRSGGRMEPTARALELSPSVNQIVRQSERLMNSDVGFNPATSERRFTARMSDLVGYLALPAIVGRLRRSAPFVSLNILPMSPETLKALESDQLDFAVSMSLVHSRSIRSLPLFQDEMCCLMREGHPLAKGRLTASDMRRHRHLQVAMSPDHVPIADLVLAEQGMSRKVAVSVPNWLLIPAALQQADLLAVVSKTFAARFANNGLVAKPLPFKAKPRFWSLYWHRRYDKSAPQVWIRQLVHEACRALG
jgi:DNA-binding transcriptional LysR family regulator